MQRKTWPAATLAAALAVTNAPAHADFLDDVKEGLNRAGEEIDRALGQDEKTSKSATPDASPEDEKQAPEPVSEKDAATPADDPKLDRVRNVTPVDRIAHSTADGLRVRALPGTDTQVAGSLSRNQVVRVTARVPGSYNGYDWVRIRLDGNRIAYAAAKFLAPGRPDTDDAESGRIQTAGSAATAPADEAERSQEAAANAGDDAGPSSGPEDGARERKAPSAAGDTPHDGRLDNPLTYADLLDLYAATNPEVVAGEDFRDAYARRYLCDGLNRVREDEFISRSIVLEKAGEKIQARADETPGFTLRTPASDAFSFGQYQPDRKAFPMRFDGEDVPAQVAYTLNGEDTYCDYGTKVSFTVPDPANPVWPSLFHIKLYGLDRIEQLKMPVDEARALVRERKSEGTGYVDRELSLRLEIEVIGQPATPAEPDMLGRRTARQEELVSTVEARVVHAQALVENGQVLQTWGSDAFADVEGAPQASDAPAGPHPITEDRLTALRYTMASDGAPDFEAIARKTPEVADINEFERAEMIDRVAGRLSGVEDPGGKLLLPGKGAALGKYNFDTERFMMTEEHSDTNWRAHFTNGFKTATGETVAVAPVADFELTGYPMEKGAARTLLEKFELLNASPDTRSVAYEAVLDPVSYDPNGKIDKPWVQSTLGYSTFEGPVIRVEVEEVRIKERFTFEEPRTLFVWTPEAEQ